MSNPRLNGRLLRAEKHRALATTYKFFSLPHGTPWETFSFRICSNDDTLPPLRRWVYFSTCLLWDRAYGADSSPRQPDHCEPKCFCHSHAFSTWRCDLALVRSAHDHTDHFNLHAHPRNGYAAPHACIHCYKSPATHSAIAIRADSIYAVRITRLLRSPTRRG